MNAGEAGYVQERNDEDKQRGGIEVDRTVEKGEREGARGEEEEEVELPPGKGRTPPVGPAALPQGARLGYPRYQSVCTEEITDLERVVPSETDHCLVQVYGNHLHHNDGRHMDVGITDNDFWLV